MRLRGSIGAVLVVLLMVVGPARALEGGCDRQCRIEAANAYLAALVSHDGDNVPLADDAWRQENGGSVLQGGDNIRAGLEHPIMYVITGMHDLRWYAQGDEVTAVYYLDTVAPTYIFERFKVNDAGLITEIDAHFYIDTSGHVSGPESVVSNPFERREALLESNHGPAGPVPVKAGDTGDDEPRTASTCGEECVLTAAHAFLDAMATGDATAVPLAAGATQTINHRPIDDIGANLATGAATIGSVADRIVQVDGDQATVLYHLELRDGGRHYGAARFATVDGAITEIEAVCDGAELCS